MYTLGKRLKDLRKKKKMRQEDLAEKLGVSKSAIGMYERDEREPSVELLHKIADFFDVSIDYLFCRIDDPTPNEKGRYLAIPGSDIPPLDLVKLKEQLINNEVIIGDDGEPLDDKDEKLFRDVILPIVERLLRSQH